MKCPKCNGLNIKVNQTLRVTGSDEIYRKRKCLLCGHNFDTVEAIAVDAAVIPPTPAAVASETPVKDTPVEAIPVEEEAVEDNPTPKRRPARRKAEGEKKDEE